MDPKILAVVAAVATLSTVALTVRVTVDASAYNTLASQVAAGNTCLSQRAAAEALAKSGRVIYQAGRVAAPNNL
jgi:D-alanyl-D-alanine dipeptidase